MTFPGAGAQIYRNEDGEPLGWDDGYAYAEEREPGDYDGPDYDEEDD